MKKLIAISLTLSPILSGHGQLRMGLPTNNYHGTTGLFINPSSIVDNPVWLDIRLVGAGASIHNNYLYLPNTTIYPYLNQQADFSLGMDNYTRGFKHAYASTHINGPAFTLNIKEHAIGLSTSIRSYTSANRIPHELAKLSFEDLSFGTLQNQSLSVNNASVSHTNWGEIGLSYGKLFNKSHNGFWKAAGTLKRLYGISAFDLLIRDLNYEVNNLETFVVDEFNGNFSYTEPAWKAGKGWGIDLGVTYVKTNQSASDYVPHSKSSSCEPIDYRYKLGVSLLDLGYIRYIGSGTRAINYNNGEGDLDVSEVNSVPNAQSSLENLTNEAGSFSESNSFTQFLPAAVSVQFDYNTGRNIYLNASLVQNALPSKLKGASRYSVISFTPRYETKLLAISMPLSFIEYRYPSLGFQVRFHGLSIGSDFVSPFIYKHDISRADIYFNWSIPIYKSPECREGSKRTTAGSKRNRKKNSKDAIKFCPVLED